jgi:hypothetical protein
MNANQRSYNWRYCVDFVLTGNSVAPYGAVPPGTYKVAGDTEAIVHTAPFVIYTPYTCAGQGPLDSQGIDDFLTDVETVHSAYGLAAALWMGDGYDPADTTQPTLRRVAVNISAASPYEVDDGVTALLVHYEQATGGSGGAMIHMPVGLVPQAIGGVPGGARVAWPEGNVYRGAMGSVIVPGPGYPEGFSPTGPRGHGPLVSGVNYAGNEMGTSWMYVTGPVEYAMSPVRMFPEAVNERIQYRQNLYAVFAERDAIVRFDTDCVFAVQVWNPAPLPEVS